MDRFFHELILQLMIGEYPLIHWIIFNCLGLPAIFYITKILSIFFKNNMNNQSKISIMINFFSKDISIKNIIIKLSCLMAIIFPFYILVKFSITKSSGYLIYPCVFSIIATVVVIFFALKQDKSTTLEPTKRKKCPKQKHLNSKVRANNKQDNKINIKGYNTKTDKYRKKNNI